MDQGLFANLHAYVQINPALAPIAERLQLKRLVPMAVDQAIVEIITPVVERSVTIACMTAQELIVKVLHVGSWAPRPQPDLLFGQNCQTISLIVKAMSLGCDVTT